MDRAPVIIFAYERIDNLKKTIESIENCELANETDCFVFSDYYDEKKENYDKVCCVRAFLDEFKTKNSFSKVEVDNATRHKGLANSVIEGVTKIIEKYGRAIIVEDDLIVANSFLRYMNDALQCFEDNEKIWSISGYSLCLKSTQNIDSDIYLSMRGSSWGWATWYDRWNTVDWDVKDYDSFVRSEIKVNLFNKCGEDLTKLLTMWKNKQIDSWAIRFDYAQFCQEKYTVFPKKSQVVNIGMNGEGTNCDKSLLKIYKTYLYNLNEKIDFNLIGDYRKIEKEKARAYSSKFISRLWIVFARWYVKLLRCKEQQLL